MSFEEYLNIFYLKFFVFTRMNCQVSNTCLPTNCLLFGTTWVHPLISLWDYLSSPPDFTSGLLEFNPWFHFGTTWVHPLISEGFVLLFTFLWSASGSDYWLLVWYLLSCIVLYCIVLYCIVLYCLSFNLRLLIILLYIQTFLDNQW
jgi:hypothetical protein